MSFFGDKCHFSMTALLLGSYLKTRSANVNGFIAGCCENKFINGFGFGFGSGFVGFGSGFVGFGSDSGGSGSDSGGFGSGFVGFGSGSDSEGFVGSGSGIVVVAMSDMSIITILSIIASFV